MSENIYKLINIYINISVYVCIYIIYVYMYCHIYVCLHKYMLRERGGRKKAGRKKKGRKCGKLLRIDDLRWKVYVYLLYMSSNFNISWNFLKIEGKKNSFLVYLIHTFNKPLLVIRYHTWSWDHDLSFPRREGMEREV